MEFTGERFIPNEDADENLAIEHLIRYNSVKNIASKKRVVDAACGEGYGSYILAQSAEMVYGIDISAEAIEHAKNKYKRDNLIFLNNSIDKISIEDDSIDIVISFETIEHVDENVQNLFMHEALRMLNNDGVLIISTPDKKNYSDKYNYSNEYHIKEFYREEFRQYLKKFFKNVILYSQDDEVVNYLRKENSRNSKITFADVVDYEDSESRYVVAVCSNTVISSDVIDLETIAFPEHGKYNELVARMIELQDEVETQSHWGIKLDLEIKKKDKLIYDLNSEVSKLSNWGQSLDRELLEVRDVLKEKTKEIESLSSWGIDLDLELSKANRNLKMKSDEVKALSTWGSELDSELRGTQQTLKEKFREIEKVSNWSIVLSDEINRANAYIQNQNQQIDSLSKWGLKLESELNSAYDIVKNQQEHIEKISKWAISLDEEIINLSSLARKRQDEIDTLSSWSHILEKEKKSIVEEYNSLLNEKSGLDEIIKSKLTLINELEKLNEQKLNENSELNIKVECISNQLNDYEKQIQLLKKEYSKLDMLNVNLQEDVNILNEKNDTLHNKSSELEKQLISQVEIIDNLRVNEKELQKIYSSKGWKLLLRLYKLSDFFLPQHSKRRLLFNLLINFKNIRQHINKISMLKFFNHIGESGSQLEARISKYISYREPYTMKTVELYSDRDTNDIVSFNNHDNPLVSIVIPVYNQFDMTMSCLKSIRENTSDIGYEVIIGDDLSNDETKNINQFSKNVKIIRNETNLGFLRNCNNAAKHASGQYILFLNNDTNVQAEWLKHLLDVCENDSSVGLVGSKLVYPNGILQEAGGILWNDGSAWNYGRNDDASKPEYNYLRETDYISGAAIMIRTSLWKKIGGFDERYVPAYCEDSDLAFEVRKLGYKVIYQPKSVVVHFEGQSNGTDIESGIKKYQVVNQEKFKIKWRDVLQREHYPNAECVFHARGKTSKKKSILIIDHYVPHYDKDAGSRTMFMYIKMFIELGYNVKFLGDNFYPHQPYTDQLEKIGVEVLYGPWHYNHYEQWIEENGKYFDFIYMWRPHITMKYIDLVKKHSSAKLVYYVVDLHYLRELRQYDIVKDENLKKSSNKWKEVERKIIDACDTVLTISYDEKEIIEDEFGHQDVKVFPAFFYDDVNVRINKDTKDLLFVGGFVHTPNVDAVTWFVNEIFDTISERLPEVKFIVVGSNPTEEIENLKSERVIIKGFVSDEELEELYRTSRVSVIPLRFGAGVKGKTVEAMYNGIPIVSTNIGIEGLIDLEKIIPPQNSAQEFANKVLDIYMSNDNRLDQVSSLEQDYIRKYFTHNAAQRVIEDIFR